MSTKTTFKRIALVAVAALGLGVLTSVAPATAATGTGITPTALNVGTIPTAQVGVSHSTPISIVAAAATLAAGGSDTTTINVRVTSAPVGSAFRTLANQGKLADGTTAGTLIASTFASGNNVGALVGFTAVSGGIVQAADLAGDLMTVGTNFTTTPKSAAAISAGSMGTLSVDITPDVAGTYTVLVSADNTWDDGAGLSSAYAAGQTNVSYTFTTGAAVTAVALSAVTGTSTKGSATGQVIKVTLTGTLGLNETISITDNSSTARLRLVSARSATGHTLDANATTLTMTSAHFVGGVGYFLVNDTAKAVSVITAAGSGLLSPTISSTLSVETVDAYVPTAVTMSDTAANVLAGGQANHVSGITAAASVTDVASTVATSHSYLATVTAGTAGDYLTVLVDDAQGRVTGVVGLDYTYALATATTTTATVTVAAACATAGACFTATVDGTTDGVVAVTAATPAQATVTVAGSTSATMRAAFGASSALTVVVRDQFRNALANSSASITTAGRNASTAATILNTDANGIVSFTRTDAGTATTANKQDVVTFAGPTAGSATVTINYTDSTLGISTVTLATPTTDDTAASGITYTDINASSSAGATGPTTARTWTTITATVKDVNGAVLIGVPVTFATSSAGAAVASTFATVYTGADGTAASRVYGWTAGVKTFTATAGTTVATGTVAFRQGGPTGTDNPTEVRTISAVMTGNSIIVTATDRFGNVVSGVPLWATRTGNGTFGGGSNTNGQTTGVNGTAEFLFNAGSSDSVVTITAGSATAQPLPCYGQTGNLAGIAVCSTAATQTAYTASVAGTTTVAEIGVGASFAPAGIGSVTVAVPAGVDSAQTAADAAAEATDAANAATDAANAAAEAADAATAAAQDAADAVAALSTQVTELVSALRKQITSLTNLVIKIQRKVRA
jgi:trimeric autotransporter adhesin